LMNRDGFFVLPTSETLKAAIKEASLTLPNPDEDWSGIIDKVVNQPGENSYPITSFSFIILRKTYDPVKAELVKEFFGWVLTEGEKPENVLEGYVPLPPEAAQIGLKALEMIKEV
ncbi:phosphate ABC transporter substrate-binding protein PstS, partial [Candidatus Bathyarchaeota archaeon ex4484_40]